MRPDDPISEYYALNPDDYFADLAMRYIEPNNPYIAKMHVYLMAREEPLSEDEIARLGIPRRIVEELCKEGALIKLGNAYHANELAFDRYFKRSIRGSGESILVYWGDRLIDEREITVGLRELHPNAIYFNRGVKFVVERLEAGPGVWKAYVKPAPKELEQFYTKPLFDSTALPLEGVEYEKREVCGTVVYYGEFLMTLRVWGYALFREGDKRPLGLFPLERPLEYTYKTYGIVFTAPRANYDSWELRAGAYHALEHVIIEGTNAVTGGGSEDLGGISFGDTGLIVVHDAIPGGNGVSRLLFEHFEDAVERAYKLLKSCKCPPSMPDCNRCVMSYHCGNNNRPLNQRGALELLERMLRGERVLEADKALERLRIVGRGIV